MWSLFFVCVTNIVEHALEEYRRLHGSDPKKIVVGPSAAVVLSLSGGLAPSVKGIPLEISSIDPEKARRPGDGNSLAVVHTFPDGGGVGAVKVTEYQLP